MTSRNEPRCSCHRESTASTSTTVTENQPFKDDDTVYNASEKRLSDRDGKVHIPLS